ncbi:hypothetical protein ACLOJK_024716 [Asimina triloba]
MAASRSPEEFSVVVLASDLGVDARSLLSAAADVAGSAQQQQQDDVWHDCPSSLVSAVGEDFSDIEALQAFRVEGVDKAGNRIFRIVGKFFPGSLAAFRKFSSFHRPPNVSFVKFSGILAFSVIWCLSFD